MRECGYCLARLDRVLGHQHPPGEQLGVQAAGGMGLRSPVEHNTLRTTAF